MATPRATCPAASERGLPTSLMTRPVTAAARSASASATAYSAAALAGAGVSAHPRAAAAARSTVAATSASLASCHSPMTSAGSCGLRLVIVMTSPPASFRRTDRQHHLATRAFRAPQGVRSAPSLPGGAKAGDTYLGHADGLEVRS